MRTQKQHAHLLSHHHYVVCHLALPAIRMALHALASRSQRYTSAPHAAPSSGAATYTHCAVHTPATRAGPSDRAGFIDAPEIGPANSASNPTVAPMANAAACPTARVSVATAMITSIRPNDRIASNPNDCHTLPLGTVAPTCATGPSSTRSATAAATAPPNCAPQ